MKPRTGRWAVLATVVAVLVLVLGLWAPWTQSAERDPGGGKGKGKDGAGSGSGSGSGRGGGRGVQGPLKVSAVVVKTEPFAERITSTGTLRAEEGVELQAEIAGKVVAINFTEGSRVKVGELLVKLNDADLQATLARARSRRELARRRQVRVEQLFKEGIANLDEYDGAMNDMAVQEAEIALMEAQIAKTEIRAPFEGVVGLRFVSEGAFVTASTRIATLQRLDHLKLDFSVPERYAGRVSAGTQIRFTVTGNDQVMEGTVIAADPRIDLSTRSLLMRAVCPNAEARLLPGSFATVEITLERQDGAILVPAVAVVPGVRDKNVFVAVDGKAERRSVETGTRTESKVQILSGLKPGEILITSGLQNMRAGIPVETVVVDGDRGGGTSEPSPSGERTGAGKSAGAITEMKMGTGSGPGAGGAA